jgi:hypothetical protein
MGALVGPRVNENRVDRYRPADNPVFYGAALLAHRGWPDSRPAAHIPKPLKGVQGSCLMLALGLMRLFAAFGYGFWALQSACGVRCALFCLISRYDWCGAARLLLLRTEGGFLGFTGRGVYICAHLLWCCEVGCFFG